MTKRTESVSTNKADANRARRLQAIRILDRLMAKLANPGFDGHLTLEIHAKDGRVGTVKSGLVQLHPDNE